MPPTELPRGRSAPSNSPGRNSAPQHSGPHPRQSSRCPSVRGQRGPDVFAQNQFSARHRTQTWSPCRALPCGSGSNQSSDCDPPPCSACLSRRERGPGTGERDQPEPRRAEGCSVPSSSGQERPRSPPIFEPSVLVAGNTGPPRLGSSSRERTKTASGRESRGLAGRGMTRVTLRPTHSGGGFVREPREEITVSSGSASMRDEQADAVFVMIGAHPHTAWLPHTIARGTSGYVLTGTNIPPESWPEERPPFPHETSLPGVFAVGDVRAGSLERVASAVVRDPSASNRSTSTCLSPVTQGLAHETARLSSPAPSVVPSARAPLRTPARCNRASGDTRQLM
jgi:hypothetical protein